MRNSKRNHLLTKIHKEMTLIKSNFSVWNNLSDFFDDDWLKAKMVKNGWSPAINISETDNHFEIEVAAPGMKKDDFNVSVENGILTISAKTTHEEEEKKKNYTRKEFSSKSFTNSFTLPENVEDEKVAAKYADGILKLTLKKVALKTPPKKLVKIE